MNEFVVLIKKVVNQFEEGAINFDEMVNKILAVSDEAFDSPEYEASVKEGKLRAEEFNRA